MFTGMCIDTCKRNLLALNVLWVCLIPVWRDLHFYIAHRFLHIRAIYT